MGSQKMQAELWSAAAQDWADYQETTLLPVFEKIIGDISRTPARKLLDVGCGSGLFCHLAMQQGFDVSGLDATAELIAIAHRKTPDGHFKTDDMETLPYPDQTFDVVTGINSFQYAASPVRALEEAHRVLKPTGKLVVAIWGKAQECQAAVYLKALGGLMPPPPPGTPVCPVGGRCAGKTGGRSRSPARSAAVRSQSVPIYRSGFGPERLIIGRPGGLSSTPHTKRPLKR